MKKLLILTVMSLVFVATATPAMAAKPSGSCNTIKDGIITDKNGNTIMSGYDKYGYNYQSHMFNGFYGNYSRPAVLVTSGDKLIMKWSDSWLSNKDCNNDGKLDRGLVDGEVNGVSRGWLTNHYTGEYINEDGKVQHFTDFVKIVWTGPGSSLWGQYEIIQEVWNDKSAGYNGLFEKFGVPGFGLNNQWTLLP